MSRSTLFCPVCNKKDCLEAEQGFIEVGEYDEQSQSYEKECCVQGYRCQACQAIFYIEQ